MALRNTSTTGRGMGRGPNLIAMTDKLSGLETMDEIAVAASRDQGMPARSRTIPSGVRPDAVAGL
jgi:hypothetical protein